MNCDGLYTLKENIVISFKDSQFLGSHNNSVGVICLYLHSTLYSSECFQRYYLPTMFSVPSSPQFTDIKLENYGRKQLKIYTGLHMLRVY